MIQTTDKTWEEIYTEGRELNRYPYDSVVTFVFRNYPPNIEKKYIKILEVGCGAGNNLWFAAKEGFDVTGIDFSKSAIDYVKKRFKDEGLNGNFIVHDFRSLPFQDEEFDLIIDRAALTYINFTECKKAINEISRVLKNHGKFYFNPFSDSHSSCASGRYKSDGITTDIKVGICNGGDVCFYGKRDIYDLFKDNWKLESIQHSEVIEQINPSYFEYAEWKVIAKKVGDNYEK